MKGYKFKVEFMVWRGQDKAKLKEELLNFLLTCSAQSIGISVREMKGDNEK